MNDINNKDSLNIKNIIISSLACLIPALVSLLIWDRLPDEMATSFGFNGVPNEYMTKFQATIGATLYLVILHLLVIVAIKVDPLKDNNSDKLKSKMIYFTPILSNIIIGLIIGYSLDYNFDMNRIMFLFISILFIIFGNFMPKCKKNYTIGVRTAWTLNSEDNWYYTHRVAGKVWFYCGIIGLANALLLNNIQVFFILLLITCFSPIAISYNYYRKFEQNNQKVKLDE
ncbi:MAG: SdpI family protein [bacterium]